MPGPSRAVAGDRTRPTAPATRPRSPARSRPAGRTAGTPRARSRRPNPAGPLAEPEQVGGRPKLFVLDMFPYPSGAGLHVGHPLGYIGTDVYARYQRMTGHNVLHTMGFDAFGLPAEQYAVADRHAPAGHHRAEHRQRTGASCAGWAWATTRAAASPPPTPAYYRWTQWIFLQIFNAWYDADAGPGPADRRAGRRVRAGRPADARRPAVGRARRRSSSAAGRRRPPPGLPRRGAGQLVPRAWAPCWPTRRSPPTAAATAATSRCSSATCASG